MPYASLSFTASVDGGSPTDHSLAYATEVYNVTMYNITSLSLGSHALLVTLLDVGSLQSYLFFDYAFVNTTVTNAVDPFVKSTSR